MVTRAFGGGEGRGGGRLLLVRAMQPGQQEALPHPVYVPVLPFCCSLLEHLQALAELPDLWISIDFTGSERRLPDPLIDALAALPQCRLRIGDGNAWSSVQIKNPDALARITHLQALDLSSCELDDIQLVIGLAELELLKVRPRSDLSKKLGGCSFHTPGEVAKLKLQMLGMS